MQKKSKIIIASIVSAILLIVGVFSVVALTGSSGNDTQTAVSEKLSFGQKFLLDLEYDKAVAEFNAVIEIEPKNADAYIGLADAYIGLGEEDKAIETLEKGFAETGDEKIRAKLDEMKKPEETTAEATTTPEVTTTVPETTTTVETTTTPEVTTTAPKGTRTERLDYDDGSYYIHEYDSDGNCIKSSRYNADGTLDCYCIYEYDSDGNMIKISDYEADGTLDRYYICEYDSNGNCIKSSFYNADGTLDCYYTFEYYDNSGFKKAYKYLPDGTFDSYSLFEYYESGYFKNQTWYDPSGNYMGGSGICADGEVIRKICYW